MGRRKPAGHFYWVNFMRWFLLAFVVFGLFGCAGSPPDRYKSANTERPRKGEDKQEKK
jgi:hypothetical protein